MTPVSGSTAPIPFPPPAPARLRGVLWVLVGVGVLSLVLGHLLVDPVRVWQAYLVNLLFWSSLAQGGIVFSAVYRQANGRWGEPFRYIAESLSGFLPISFLLFLVLFLGHRHIYSWAQQPVHGKELWLSSGFLFARDGLALLVLLLLSAAYLYHSQRPTLGKYRHTAELPAPVRRFVDKLAGEWRGDQAEAARSRRVLGWLTPLLLVAFVVLYSLIAFDLVMSVDPHWYSTLFGWFYSVSTFYLTLAGLGVATVVGGRLFGIRRLMTAEMYHDLGKLLFGFCLLTGGFFWTRYLVIWYGNLSEEIHYVMVRMHELPWAVMSWGVVGLGYMLPLALLLSRPLKRKPGAILVIGTLITIVLWVERFVSIAPSVWQKKGIPLGPIELGITLGFLAGFALSWLGLARNLPLLSPAMDQTSEP